MAQRNKPIGILLAAGQSRRFGKAKLLTPLADGTPMAVVSARKLLLALDHVVAVVAATPGPLAGLLEVQGCDVIPCHNSDEGMGTSLACAVAHRANGAGWLIALADMPLLQPQTIHCIGAVLDGRKHTIVAPVYHGKRGHPVAFGHGYRAELARLRGDQGARTLLQKYPSRLERVEVDDVGICIDIDTPADLARWGIPRTAKVQKSGGEDESMVNKRRKQSS